MTRTQDKERGGLVGKILLIGDWREVHVDLKKYGIELRSKN